MRGESRLAPEIYIPPYSLTDPIIHLVAEISEQVGMVSIKTEMTKSSSPGLRRENQIRSIHSSLAIENNTLSIEQVTDVINGKRVLGSQKEIREVKNAYEAYNMLLSLDPFSIEDLLCAHMMLMTDLLCLSVELAMLTANSMDIPAA